MNTLKDKTLFITGASRGIGRAIALRCAADGANIVIAAKSAQAHPKLKGSIHEVAAEVEAAGGRALALQMDVRDETQVSSAVQAAAQHFGGIDMLINNAGAISLSDVASTEVKRYDLMQDVNARAVFVCSRAALPFLKQSAQAHILSLCPPINLESRWLKAHAPYTLSKYGMTLLSLGMAEEFKSYDISVNCLWPKTIIATAAIEFAVGDHDLLRHCRTPQIVADAAYTILNTNNRQLTGQCLLDEEILRQHGITDFDVYAQDPDNKDKLQADLFLSS